MSMCDGMNGMRYTYIRRAMNKINIYYELNCCLSKSKLVAKVEDPYRMRCSRFLADGGIASSFHVEIIMQSMNFSPFAAAAAASSSSASSFR